MKIAWRVLLSFGGLMVLYAIVMDTTVSRGGERFHNVGLQQQQLMLLILGCVMFLAGIGLFGVAKLKQTPREAEEDAKASQERAERAKASARAIDAGARNGLGAMWASWLRVWHKVRRPYVLAAAVVVLGFTLLFPQHAVTYWLDNGVKVDASTPMFIFTANAPLLVGELISDFFWRALVFALLYWKARP